LSSHIFKILFFIVVAVSPLGVAGQNIGLGVALVGFLYLLFRQRELRSQLFMLPMNKTLLPFSLCWIGIMVPIAIATMDAGRVSEFSRFFWGYLYVAVMPYAAVLFARSSSKHRGWSKPICWIVAIMSIVAVTQFVFGWKLDGGSIVSTVKRSQGFYSHPLTFAYVILVAAPWTVARFFTHPSDKLVKLTFFCMMAMVLASQSMTVTCIYFGSVFIAIIRLTRARTRIYALLVAVSVVTAGLLTENPVSRKVETVLAGKRGDRETPYKDDRIAFWHAHTLMFRDSPILGHGSGLEADDRRPYYEMLGLAEIRRMYEAHNMYLQYAVEGGFLPPLSLLALLCWMAIASKQNRLLSSCERFAYIATPVCFALGGLTQNAIQDSEVRYVFMIYTAMWASRMESGELIRQA
jgi:O-antigen ligase